MQMDKASNKKLLKTKTKKVFILKQNKTANLKYIYTPQMKKNRKPYYAYHSNS